MFIDWILFGEMVFSMLGFFIGILLIIYKGLLELVNDVVLCICIWIVLFGILVFCDICIFVVRF